ncbi:MAG: tRNA-binding protein [Devosia sp.]|nr:tRNA-binding protein [Devosia sp.]
MSETISFDDFLKVDIRAGTVIEARPFPEARKPAIILLIDFGPGIGVKKSSAQITVHYEPEALIGRQVMAVVNFPPRQIGPLRSDVLTLGFEDAGGAIVLAAIDKPVPNGQRLM